MRHLLSKVISSLYVYIYIVFSTNSSKQHFFSCLSLIYLIMERASLKPVITRAFTVCFCVSSSLSVLFQLKYTDFSARLESFESSSVCDEYTQQSGLQLLGNLAVDQICWMDIITDDIYSWWICPVTQVIKGEELPNPDQQQADCLFYGPLPCVVLQLLHYCFITVVRPWAFSLSEQLITHSHANNHNSICAVSLISPFLIFRKTN